jgi:hypothetical protein
MAPEALARLDNESGHQKALFAWAAMAAAHGVAAADDPNSYAKDAVTGGNYAERVYGRANALPVLAWLYANPNGGKRDKVTAARMKAEGARAGVWDVHLPAPSPQGRYRDLWLEMKRPKTADKRAGVLSADQVEFGELQKLFGSHCAVCMTWREAVDAVKFFINN